MTVLTREEILNRIVTEEMIEEYIDLDKQLQSCGFDVTLRRVLGIKGFGVIDFDNTERKLPEYKDLEFDKQDRIMLDPGDYIVELNEIVNLPLNIIAIVFPRSSLLRCGCTLHSAVWDPGYRGRGKLVLHVGKTIVLKRNARIGQMIFFKLSDTTDGYKGIYQYEGIVQTSVV
jgi:dUTP pyrophosphatase